MGARAFDHARAPIDDGMMLLALARLVRLARLHDGRRRSPLGLAYRDELTVARVAPDLVAAALLCHALTSSQIRVDHNMLYHKRD